MTISEVDPGALVFSLAYLMVVAAGIVYAIREFLNK